MTTNTALKTAIFQAVDAFADAQSLPVAYPGVSFTKPVSGEWLELSVSPNDRDYGLSDQYKFKRGIIQLNVCGYKDKSGDLALQAIADSIAGNWGLGDTILDAVQVTTNPMTEEAITRDNTDYIIPVSFEYAE